MDTAQAIQQHCTPLLKQLMNNKNAAPFNVPVDYIKLGIPEYPKIVSQPMDLGTVETKLASGVYEQIDEWIDDVRLVFGNAKTFNPADHVVHKMAKMLEQNFDKRLPGLLEKVENRNNIQGGSSREQAAVESDWIKKAKTILKQVMDHPESYPFHQPVDWKKLKIPDYPQIITHPMDLSKIERRIKQLQYGCVEDFIDDLNLVWKNAMTYNVDLSPIHQMAQKLKGFFEESCTQAFGSGGIKRKRETGTASAAHIMPEEPSEEEVTRPVTVEEKRDLNEKINMLESEDLGKMVDIIEVRCAKCIDRTDDGIEIDIDLLEPGNLRYVAKFVTACCDRYVVS
eukprot:TRINITY_DN585_c0_g1_i1.p1 TRINITY_DN585_c0_g1~~TRINITY_DN585_c0_g1_i1.p1  ORF type:complete len:340 (+),score=85.39 TRINITY_DN585_c0_g1_i1:253-1272(+)